MGPPQERRKVTNTLFLTCLPKIPDFVEVRYLRVKFSFHCAASSVSVMATEVTSPNTKPSVFAVTGLAML